jgi:hypothetical protein
MNDSENRRRQTFARVQQFFLAHDSDFIAGSMGKTVSTTLGTIITELDGYAQAEASGMANQRQGTVTRALARSALREDLEAINRTARTLSDEVPGISEKFRMPAVGNDQILLTTARAFGAEAEPLATQLIAHELPANFLADLDADIAVMEAAINDQASGTSNHAAMNDAIDDAIDRGINVVRKLDAIVKNKYANNPAVLGEWASASHNERAPRHKQTTSPQPPSPSPPSPPA